MKNTLFCFKWQKSRDLETKPQILFKKTDIFHKFYQAHILEKMRIQIKIKIEFQFPLNLFSPINPRPKPWWFRHKLLQILFVALASQSNIRATHIRWGNDKMKGELGELKLNIDFDLYSHLLQYVRLVEFMKYM